MTCNPCNNPCNNIEVEELGQLPIDTLDSTPDYFLTERAVLDESTGKVLHSLTRTPGDKVLGSGDLANKFLLDGNNPTIEPVEGQPIPAYVANEGVKNVVYPANANHHARFFVVGKLGDYLVCQNSGVIQTLGGNQYIPGADYYLSSTPGEVTTNSGETGQLLFNVLSNTKLAIMLGK